MKDTKEEFSPCLAFNCTCDDTNPHSYSLENEEPKNLKLNAYICHKNDIREQRILYESKIGRKYLISVH